MKLRTVFGCAVGALGCLFVATIFNYYEKPSKVLNISDVGKSSRKGVFFVYEPNKDKKAFVHDSRSDKSFVHDPRSSKVFVSEPSKVNFTVK